MKKTLEDIRTRLQDNEYKNKEHFRISLVLRIFQMLGWNLWNPNEFYPDFIVSPKKNQFQVDVALFAVPSTPSVFIEIKPPEKFEQNIKEFELLLNDFERSNLTLFTVLTDGTHWRFYYSQTDEKFSYTCFKTINIIEDDIDEIKSSFETYLSKNQITNGNAQRDAKNCLWQNIISQAVTEVIPKARLLVNEPPYPRLPQAIVQLVTQKGFKITEDEVIKILEKIENQKLPHPKPVPAPSTVKKPLKEEVVKKETIKKEAVQAVQEEAVKKEAIKEEIVKEEAVKKETIKKEAIKEDIIRFDLLGKKYSVPSWKELLIRVCDVIHELHSSEFQKCLKLGSDKGYYFSKSIDDLAGNEPLPIGNKKYYVMTNLDTKEIMDLVHRILVIFGYNTNNIKITDE